MNIFSGISKTLFYLRKDKVVLSLSFIPIILGMLLYYFLGKWLYNEAFTWLKIKINSFISIDTYGSFLNYILAAILSIILYFLINWTFLLLVGLLASPFNDLLSERVEKLHLKQDIQILNQFSGMFKNIIFTIKNELKKICLLLLLNMIALFFSWIPFLFPVSILLSACLLSINFLDYPWSRHNLAYKACFLDFKKSWIVNILMGLLLFVIMTIPIVNLLLIPLSVIFFTLTFVERNNEIE